MIAAVALDLGTTSIKAGLLDRNGELHSIVAQPAPPITVSGERYESSALAYAQTAEQVLAACLAQTDSRPALGLCSQRSSFLIWERASGQPITPLISWQDKRGAPSCDALRDSAELIRTLTGLRLTPYYFAPKLRTLLQDNPHWRERLTRGELLLGTLDTFLIWRWTDGKQHVTDVSMAARTLLLDTGLLMKTGLQQWSPALCDLFDIPAGILPHIKSSTGLNLPLNRGLVLQASAGDQSAALVASIAGDSAEALVNLGTGGFVVRYLGHGNNSSNGYLQTLVYQDGTLPAHVALEGTLNSIAAALAPYPVAECRTADLAATDIFCLAEPSGLGAPYFRSDIGLRFSASIEQLTPRQIAALLLEGIIFRVARIVEDFHRASALERVYLCGGLSELTCLQQGLAQCVPVEVYRLQQKDASLQGAALLAAGMEPASRRAAARIAPAHNTPALADKYRRWKHWFDLLLGSRS